MKKITKLFSLTLVSMLSFTISANAQEVNNEKDLTSCLVAEQESQVCTLSGNIETKETHIVPTGNITLDLNGYSITANHFTVNGKLTINDSKKTGNMVLEGNNGFEVDGNKAELVINDGNIEVNNGYGVYTLNGGKATINGGSLTSKYSSLAGNNTTGAMYFVINDGTLTTKFGPNVYLSGPVSLNITGGTLNGGISLRMGKVNISGGTINAIKDNIDPVDEYYNFSNNAWLADALYVWGGTYSTNVSGETNVLDLKITGGTFNSNNGKGSAVAIYDLGAVKQEKNINITGGVFNTNSTNRRAYQVVSLDDIGVKNPTGTFGTQVGTVNTSITGGTFNTKVDYVAPDYIIKEKDSKYIVALPVKAAEVPVVEIDKEVKEITTGVADIESVENELIKSLEKSEIDTTGKNATVELDITNVDEKSIDTKVVENINKILTENNKDARVAGYIDINLNVIDSDTGLELGKLTELNKKIKLNVVLPKDLKNVKEGYKRIYYIVRDHDGIVELLDTTLSSDENFVSFETDKFSTYALAYTDQLISADDIANPSTFDDLLINCAAGLISLIGLGGAILYIKKSRLG